MLHAGRSDNKPVTTVKLLLGTSPCKRKQTSAHVSKGTSNRLSEIRTTDWSILSFFSYMTWSRRDECCCLLRFIDWRWWLKLSLCRSHVINSVQRKLQFVLLSFMCIQIKIEKMKIIKFALLNSKSIHGTFLSCTPCTIFTPTIRGNKMRFKTVWQESYCIHREHSHDSESQKTASLWSDK